ncbi:MAG: uracil-DNA glycosylase [Woeseiaceae bacterium]
MQSEHQRRAYLEALGIDVWAPAGQEPVTEDAPEVAQSASGMDWSELRACVAECKQCPLHASRTQAVFGVGNENADWLIVGEAPGAEEDRRGEPFVGRAGQLLDEMLRAAGQQRERVFIANVLKCRPPNNRDPEPSEAAACRRYLQRQVELIQPQIILAVGRIAAQQLLDTDTPVGRLRGELHQFGETPLVVTYHPAYLLRSPTQKRKAWQDLCLAMDAAAGRAA